MKKFNAEEALKGAPVKLRNGQKAYIEKYNEGAVFVYSGYVDDENETITSWTKEGTEYCFIESQRDIISMWQEEDEDSVIEDDTKDNLEAGQVTEENIFEKALDKNLPLRHTTQRADVPNFYCIAKTRDGDYILERENRGTKLIARLSSLTEDLDWYIVEPARPVGSIPKAFIPKVGEAFWYVSPTYHPFVRHKVYKEDEQNIIDAATNGVAFRTKEDAIQMLLFLKQNIECNKEEK
jgi:hypothetical protein